MADQGISVTRRNVLLGGAGFAALSSLSPMSMADTSGPVAVNFADPVEELRAHVKMVGSLETQQVISFLRLNIYADSGEGNYAPLFTMNNLLLDQWENQGNNQFQMKKYEAGYYTELDSYNHIESFVNPYTKKTHAIKNFLLGPVPRRYTPEGFFFMAYKPNPLPLEIIGDRVFLATQSMESFQIPGQPGNTRYINSFMTYSASLADMQNPDMASAPVHAQLNNKTEWAPWMGMEGLPGGTVARGYGTKLSGLDALPEGVLDGFRQHTPKILDIENWKEFVTESS